MWAETHKILIERWHSILTQLKSGAAPNYIMLFVAIRELLDLTQTTLQAHPHQVETVEVVNLV
jgi:glutamate dehydrogenase